MTDFVLTQQHIENATTYLPIAVKAALAQTLAEQCVEAMEQPDAPPVYRLNPLNRELCLAMVLLKHYLKILPDDGNLGAEFGAKDYDYYEGVQDKFSPPDFVRFAAMLDTCIQSEIAVRNDPCTRLMKMVQQMTTPEIMQQALSQIQTVSEEIKNFKPVATMPQKEFEAATRDM